MQDLETIDMSESLRQLSYLQLCVVPSFIEPYLARLSAQELKTTFFMFMQTFFEVNSESIRTNNCGEPFSMLKDYSRKPIGQQMIHLLKSTLAFYISQDYPIHTFFLEFDQNTEPNMIHLQKALLSDLTIDAKFQTAISLILLSFDLTLEIYEIRRGNAKFLLNFSGKSENFQLQMETESLRRKRYTQVVSVAESLRKSESLTENLRDLCDYCCELANKYEFVVFSKIDRQPKREVEKIEICDDQIDEEPNNFENYLELHDAKYWYLTSQNDSFEMISCSYANLLRNFSEQSVSSIEKLKNCALALINRLTSSRSDSQTQNRTSIYALIAALQLLAGIKQKNSDKEKLAEASQQLFKEVMQFQVCSIKTTFYFLIAFLQLDIEEQSIYNRIINLIGWVMSQYRKYNFKSEELIYADFIASSLDLLVSWKQSSKPEEEDKQVETVLTRLASKTKAHGQQPFGLFFQTLNLKLLNYVSICLLKARCYSFKSNEIEIFDQLLLKFQEQIHQCVTFLTVPQLKEKSKELENTESSLLYVYLIVFSKKWKAEKEEQLLGMRLYHLLKSISQPNRVDFKKEILGLLVKKCLQDCFDRFINCLNVMLLEYNVTSAKKKQTNIGLLSLNAQAKRANAFIEQSFSAITFLNLSMFAINPIQHQDFLIFSLVLDSHCLQQNATETIIQLYTKVTKSIKMKWSGDETKILKYSRRYDTLETFFEQILQTSDIPELQHNTTILSFQKFCREWCAEQTNYQWLSDNKASRIRLLALKSLCTRAQQQFQ